MQISIEYCVARDYGPGAASLAVTLRERLGGLDIGMIPSGGGRFEVVADGRLIYSKAATGRHPTHDEILAALA